MTNDKGRGDESSESTFEGDPSREASRAGFVPEFMRKVAVAGLGALFMTEEGIRSLAGQLKLPKEALAYILGQAEKTKDEVGRVISEELRRFLQSEKLREEVLKLLSGMTIEVQAQIRLVPHSDSSGAAGSSGASGSSSSKEGEGAQAGPTLVVTDISTRRGNRRTGGKKE